MSRLRNLINHNELREQLAANSEPRTTLSFYKYCYFAEPQIFRDTLFADLTALKVFGRIYIAHEGINAQISVPTANFDSFKNYLYDIEGLQNVRLNIAVEDDGKSFFVLKIKVRSKIVADGLNDETFDSSKTGKYLDANSYNALSKKEDVVIVDMRNHYEYEVGHFKNAMEIPSDTFREQLPMAAQMLADKKEQPIIMYCTGGIRCEKASAYMLHHGFKNVYHVEGGIINYAKTAKEQNLPLEFIGKNFVFDDRLGERITDDIISECHQCGKPADTHTNCKNDGCHLLFIQCEQCKIEMENCCTEECKTIARLSPEEQKALRVGIENDQKVFNKRKHRLRPKLSDDEALL
jgi:UPF0176 protein